jgi:hypothetical protein
MVSVLPPEVIVPNHAFDPATAAPQKGPSCKNNFSDALRSKFEVYILKNPGTLFGTECTGSYKSENIWNKTEDTTSQ